MMSRGAAENNRSMGPWPVFSRHGPGAHVTEPRTTRDIPSFAVQRGAGPELSSRGAFGITRLDRYDEEYV